MLALSSGREAFAFILSFVRKINKKKATDSSYALCQEENKKMIFCRDAYICMLPIPEEEQMAPLVSLFWLRHETTLRAIIAEIKVTPEGYSIHLASTSTRFGVSGPMPGVSEPEFGRPNPCPEYPAKYPEFLGFLVLLSILVAYKLWSSSTYLVSTRLDKFLAKC